MAGWARGSQLLHRVPEVLGVSQNSAQPHPSCSWPGDDPRGLHSPLALWPPQPPGALFFLHFHFFPFSLTFAPPQFVAWLSWRAPEQRTGWGGDPGEGEKREQGVQGVVGRLWGLLIWDVSPRDRGTPDQRQDAPGCAPTGQNLLPCLTLSRNGLFLLPQERESENVGGHMGSLKYPFLRQSRPRIRGASGPLTMGCFCQSFPVRLTSVSGTISS